MARKTKTLSPDEPLRHPDHPRPMTRRDFIRQGFVTGTTAVTGGSALLSLLMQPQLAHAAGATTIGSDIAGWASAAGCPVGAAGNLKIPFICFDLAGGANIAGSNVIVGGQGGQSDFISTAGYSKLGITAGSVPGQTDGSGAGNGDFTTNITGNSGIPGLMFHSQSALLAGILDTATPATLANVDGFVVPAVSNNDTNTNPHNPMYGIAKAGADTSTNPATLDYGAKGSLLTLIGSVASVSGGNSVAPPGLIDPSLQPTKISRPSDDIGLVDTGNLSGVLPTSADVVNVMEAVTRISHAAITNSSIRGSNSSLPQSLQDSLLCAYAKAADTANQFSSSSALDPTADPNIQTIFNKFTNGVSSDKEFLKAASVMKLVVNGYAGAGTVTMGGYDYHTGDRTTGEKRDLRAGRCIGACLEYARLSNRPLMIYVFSDGSLFSNGSPDPNGVTDGDVTLPGGKGVWTGDNSSTASVFALIYDPSAKPTLAANDRQLGYFKSSGSVNTSALTSSGLKITGANDVTSLVYTLLLNYMALHGQQGYFDQIFPSHTLGATGSALDSLIMFNQLTSVGSDGKIIVT
jgi:hypothetical protein